MVGKSTHAIDPEAFDVIAADYDAGFTRSRLGRILRARVWETMACHFTPDQQVLELACGTGTDAVWLGNRGVQIVATDGSAEMVRVAADKVHQAELADHVQVKQISLQAISDGRFSPGHLFDGVLSNFGGLNTIGEWRSLAAALAPMVSPGGKLILVVMGPFCPWEIGWHLLHGEWQTAGRRFKHPATATIGGKTIPVWYPSPRHLRHQFSPWFRHVKTESLGLWLPPSHVGHLVDKWPTLFALLNQIESVSARWTFGWGDHYILVLEK